MMQVLKLGAVVLLQTLLMIGAVVAGFCWLPILAVASEPFDVNPMWFAEEDCTVLECKPDAGVFLLSGVGGVGGLFVGVWLAAKVGQRWSVKL